MRYIKEYNNFNNIIFENSNLIIEKLTEDDYIRLNEEFNYYKYNGDGYNIDIDNTYMEKYNEIEKKIKEYLKKISPLKDIYTNTINNQIKNFEYDIKPTRHYYLKFFRKEFEDPNNSDSIVNPGLFEGIILMKNNINILTKYIVNKTIRVSEKYLIRSKDNSNYTMIISLDEDFKRKYTYDINLISQFKGRHYKDQKLKNFRFHPNGTLNNKKNLQ